MKTTSLLAGCCLLVTLGCTRVHHRFTPRQVVGRTLPIEVTINHDAKDVVHGTIYYRTTGSTGSGQYESIRLQRRADQLWTMLPTENLQASDTIEYYIDVSKNGRMTALGSPASPFVVTVLDRTEMVLANLSDRANASDTEHEVQIILYARSQPIGQPTVIYQIPGVPGNIRSPMEPDGHGNYHIVIPPNAVSGGTWRYAIEFALEGEQYRRPPLGYRSFVVQVPVEVHYEEHITGAGP